MAHNTFLFVQARPSPREAGEDFHVRPGLERSADRSGGWQALAGLQLLHPEALAARSAPLAAFPHKSMLPGWLPGLQGKRGLSSSAPRLGPELTTTPSTQVPEGVSTCAWSLHHTPLDPRNAQPQSRALHASGPLSLFQVRPHTPPCS